MHTLRVCSSRFLLLPFLLLIAACSSSTGPTVTPKLQISSPGTDTLAVLAGSKVTYTFEITQDSLAVKGATMMAVDPIAGTRTLGPTDVTGALSFTDSVSSTMPTGTYAFKFVASKAGITSSDTLRRYLKVTMQSRLYLSINAPDTIVQTAGSRYVYSAVVTSNNAPVTGATVKVFNYSDGSSSSSTTGGGIATLIGDINPSAHGSIHLGFVAAMNNMQSSDTIHKYIQLTGSRPIAVMNVAVNSQSASSIGVRWDRRSGDFDADTILATANGHIAATAVANPGKSNVILNALSPGVLYSISVHSPSAVSEQVVWATARRMGPIRIYETADNSPGQNSGVILSSGTPASVATSSPNRNAIDLVLASDITSPSGLSLVSAEVTPLTSITGGRKVFMSDAHYVAGGFDSLYYTADLTKLVKTTGTTYNSYDILPGSSAPVVLEMYDADEHFARLEIVPQPSGLQFGGNPGQHYIDLYISYQDAVNMPYASRGHARGGNAGNTAIRAK